SQLLDEDKKPHLLGKDSRPQLLDKSKNLLLDDDTGSLFIMRSFPAHSRPFNTTSTLGFWGEDTRPLLLDEDTRSQLMGKDTKP
ncbi:28260_t:CDS:2, partial [Gigaspora margarita]